ncbi:MAG: hypothetical protein HQL24_04215 [Candidatus Omnitrophica bacterium]|nr:hypothetical protein [Candidatus Omnitrophota bacterium]
MVFFFVLLSFLVTFPSTVEAGGVVARRQQIEQQRILQEKAAFEQMRQRKVVQSQADKTMESQGSNSEPVKIEDVISITDLWQRLSSSSEAWTLMVDSEPKELTVQKYIDIYREKNVYIRKPAKYYVDMIDNISLKNPELLKNPFNEVLRFVAVVEYDFDNGQDRDQLARHMLGEKMYQDNRKRLGLDK